MFLAHRIALDPTPAQATYFARACGTARFAWNWALAEWNRQYEAGGKPNWPAMRKQLNAIKREQFPWMLEVSKVAPMEAIKNLGAAFSRFFEKNARRPKFKKKGVHDAYGAATSAREVVVGGHRLRLPVIGWVKMRQELRFVGKLRRVTVSRVADRWFASILVDVDWKVPPRDNQATVGIDLGVKYLATLSTGETFDAPKPLAKELRKLKRFSRRTGRKVKGSNNRWKANRKLARLHARISNVRQDALHKLTTGLVKRFSDIAIEDLNVVGMVKNHNLARTISDVGMGEFRRQLSYKAAMYGTRLTVADRWYPSSKTCCACGHKLNALSLKERRWSCPACGAEHDRDVNAAINLLRLIPTAGHAGSYACGDRRAAKPVRDKRCRSVKQEPTSDLFAGCE